MKTTTPINPALLAHNKLISDHCTRVVDAANKSEIPIPKAVMARVITQSALELLNKKLAGVKTIDQRAKQQIAATLDVIREAFETNEVPKPQSIIDNWTNGRVQLRIHFSKQDNNRMMVEQLNALPGIDAATQQAIDETVQGFERG